ncbi:MAG: CHAT domain-containing protein [Terriglobales bacterium]
MRICAPGAWSPGKRASSVRIRRRAFLRAGAHNVIAALWDVTDVSTEQLMDKFYSELDKGTSTEAALRAAKLSLLRGSAFHKPFYWAPFQLYAGS